MIKLLRALSFALALAPFGALAASPVNINTADAAALEQVKGIGPAKAKAIVDHRRQHGPFAKVDDLVRVSGIGEKSLVQLRDQVTVGAPAKQAAAKTR